MKNDVRFATATFFLGEYERRGTYGPEGKILYCSYCGAKTESKDIGSSHNHRWEEEIINFCSCDYAKEELAKREKLAEANSVVYGLERDLNAHLSRTNQSSIVRKMMFDNEVSKLKDKYKVE